MTKTLGFAGSLHGQSFTDGELFRAAVKAAPPLGSYAKAGDGEPALGAPSMGRLRKTHAAPFREFPDPGPHDRGAGMSVQLEGGGMTSGQVWDDAPNGGVWLATGERFLWVHKGAGLAYTPEAVHMSARGRKHYRVGMVVES